MYDSAKPCAERAGQYAREGALPPLTEFRARLLFEDWTDAQVLTVQLSFMQARCMPSDLAEKIGAVRVSDLVR